MKWIKLKKDYDGHKAGELVQTEAAVALALIGAGVAEDGGSGPDAALNAVGAEALRAALAEYNTGMVTVFKDAAAALKLAGTFPTIEPGPQQADKSKSLGDFVRHVIKAGNISDLDNMKASQNRLQKEYGSDLKKGMEEGSGSQGGLWTVPVVFEKTILKEAAEEAVMLPGTTNVPLGARAVEWPALDQYQVPSKGNSAFYGGVTVSRKGENSVRDKTQPKPTTVKLEANDLTAFTQFSRDLQEDASGMLESMLVELIGGAIGFRRDWEHIWGTGVGMSFGFVNAPALIKIRRAVALLVGWIDIATMLARLTPSGRKRAVWIAHPFHEATFMTMTDPSGRYIYIPNFPGPNEGSAQVGNAMPRLAGLPVLYTEKAAVPGSLGDFTLVDRKAYLTGQRAGLEIGLSEHFLFDTDQIALRAKIRDDGQPWVKKPFTLADGSGTNTVSAFIGLQNPGGTG